ncbi:MAG: ice-binding family protein [Nanoarchaeota archaeon]|nr:ice-binding family protein [Nanoarchaeota archaeon]
MHPAAGSFYVLTCTEVTGTIYVTSAGGPCLSEVVDSTLLDIAVNDKLAAYNDAAGRAHGVGPNLNLNDGTLNGQDLAPGTYTWDTPGDVTITGDITLTGTATDVWIFQISGTLNMDANKKIILGGDAKASNIFWQVAGVVTLKPGSQFNGNILSASTIAMQSLATLNGRALSKTDVTLIANTVTTPGAAASPTTGPVFIDLDGDQTHDEGIEQFFFNIQDAIDDAISGDTIVVTAGTYDESVTINKPLTVIGAGATTIIQPALDSDGITITADNVLIKDLKITTSNSGTSVPATPNIAIAIEDTDGVEINNVVVETTGNEAMGIWVGGSSNGLGPSSGLTITGTTVTIAGEATGIYAAHSNPAHTGWTISGNTITANNGVTIELYDVSDSTVSGNILDGSTTHGNVFWASQLSDISNLVFTNNMIKDSAGSMVVFMADVFTLGDGLENTNMDTITITGNTFIDWDSRALRIGERVTNVAVNQNNFLSESQPQILLNEDVSIVDATNNWWGTTDESVVATLVSDNVDIAPILTLFHLSPTTLQATVNLESASTFVILAGSTVTSIPTAAITGDVGLSPGVGTGITGLTAGEVTGIIYVVDTTGPAGTVSDVVLLAAAKLDLTTAYLDVQGRAGPPTFISGNLNGLTLVPGLYESITSIEISPGGTLTLDAQGDTNAVFIIRSASTITTESTSQVILANGARARNVYWLAGSSATLGTNSVMKGTILSLASISLLTGANLEGRALTQTGAVTLDQSTVTMPAAAEPPVTPPSSGGGDGGGSGGRGGTFVGISPNTVPTPAVTGPAPIAAGPTPTPAAPTPGFFAGITGAVTGALGKGGALFALIFIALIVLLAVLAAVLAGRQNRAALAARQNRTQH